MDLPSDIALDREIGLRGTLRDWVGLTWHLVEPGRFTPGWHIDAVSEHLEAVYRGEIRRLVINVPPGCMKSLLTCVFFPTWEWLRNPGSRWIFASFDKKLTLRDADRSLQLITSKWFLDRFRDRVLVSPDSSLERYENQAMGWRFATSVEGKVTGWHGDYQVIDDPIKPQEATKPNLVKAQDWLRGTMSNRWRDPQNTRRVLIMQRLHEMDLAGMCIEEGYELLRLPMEYEKKHPSYTKVGGDLRTDEGQLLWPERFDAQSLPGLKKEMGSMVVAAQYQQRPVPAGGAIFKQEWIKYYTVLPEKFDKIILSWDMAFKGTDTSDYVVGQVWGQVGSNYYLIDQVRGRWDFVDTCTQFELLAKNHPKALAKLVEDKANGSAVITSFEKKIPGIVEVNPEGGKESRANAVSPLVEAGNVLLPLNAPWTKDLVSELLSFPNGANDDQVDAMSQALNYLHASATRLIEAMKKMQSRGLISL